MKRDQYGRYVLPHPETGQEKAWTRATTIAGTLKDRYGLELWDQQNVVYGIGQRQDLFTRAAACTRSDKDELSEIVERAKEAAASQSGAIYGSAIHQFAERLDRGEDVKNIPEVVQADLDAYMKALRDNQINVIPQLIETVVCLPEAEIVGTLDRVVYNKDWTLPRVGDMKTAVDGESRNGKPYNKILSYGMNDIPLQLAIYAHATYRWEGPHEESGAAGWVPMADMDQEKALVFHVPVGQGECRIYEVDIKAGWEAVQLAIDIRKWRKRKDLATVISLAQESTRAVADKDDAGVAPATLSPTSPAPEPAHSEGGSDAAGSGAPGGVPPSAQRLEWCRSRVELVKVHAGARSRLVGLWDLTDIPKFPQGGPRTDEEIDKIVGFCDLVGMEFTLPFPEDHDPADESKAKKPDRNQGRKP